MKVAALDLGTNTFLCLVVEVTNGQIKKVFHDEAQVVRLGQDVNKTKVFHPEALGRADHCLQRFQKIIEEQKPERVLAMATSAARDVGNSNELFQLASKYAIPLEIISGNKEAEITFRGATSGLSVDQKHRLVIDIGGGSTEIILGQRDQVISSISINMGCVRLTEKYFEKNKNVQPTSEQIQKMSVEVIEQLSMAFKQMRDLDCIEDLLAVAGTPTELAKVSIGSFDVKRIEGYRLTLTELNRRYEQFSRITPDEISKTYQVSEGRADVILAGVMILQTTCQLLKKNFVTVSTRGVRFGIALALAERQ